MQQLARSVRGLRRAVQIVAGRHRESDRFVNRRGAEPPDLGAVGVQDDDGRWAVQRDVDAPVESRGHAGRLYVGLSADCLTVGFSIYATDRKSKGALDTIFRKRLQTHREVFERLLRKIVRGRRYETYWHRMEKNDWAQHSGLPRRDEDWQTLQAWIVRKVFLPNAKGLATPAFYNGTVLSRDIESAADARGVEALTLDRFGLLRPPPRGFLLGFAAFDTAAISRHMQVFATVLEQASGRARRRH